MVQVVSVYIKACLLCVLGTRLLFTDSVSVAKPDFHICGGRGFPINDATSVIFFQVAQFVPYLKRTWDIF